MRVLISGAAGFFGMALTRAFARAGDTVLAVDSLPGDEFVQRPDTPTGRVFYRTCDVADRAAVLSLRDDAIEAVVHAAALTPTPEQERTDPERILDVNLGGSINLLSLARHLPGCRRFLFISSSAVFGARTPQVLREADADGSTSLYGTVKLVCEQLMLRYGAMYGLPVTAVRPTSLYGPGERPRQTRSTVTPIWTLIDAARSDTPIRTAGEEAHNDWLFVDDAAEAVHLLTHANAVNGVFNLSSAEPRPFRDVVEAVSDLLPLKIDTASAIEVDGRPDRPGVVANDRLRRAIDWMPRSLVAGIQAYVQALQRTAPDVVMSGGR